MCANLSVSVSACVQCMSVFVCVCVSVCVCVCLCDVTLIRALVHKAFRSQAARATAGRVKEKREQRRVVLQHHNHVQSSSMLTGHDVVMST